ncbi:MAG: hypothetical protein DRO09_00435 [Thermoprotei archaeon]|nr:MAG: hypothetical protein DRO09_00435 [Thermoprotei archaeon]
MKKMGYILSWMRRLWGGLIRRLGLDTVRCVFCERKIRRRNAVMLLPYCDHIDPINFLCEQTGDVCLFWEELYCCWDCFISRLGGQPYIYVGDLCMDIAPERWADDWELEEEEEEFWEEEDEEMQLEDV